MGTCGGRCAEQGDAVDSHFGLGEMDANLVLAARLNNLPAVQRLVRRGGDPNGSLNEFSPLFMACRTGLHDIADFLISQGAKVDTVNDNHRVTALHAAAAGGFLDLVTLLLRKGADPSFVDANGDSPLHWAAKFGHLPVVAHLLAREASSVYLENKFHWTPLHIAIRDGHFEVVVFFLSKTRDANFTDQEGWTLLHWAAWHSGGSTSMLDMLLERGADVNARNKEGSTCLDIAAAKGYRRLAAYLLSVVRIDRGERTLVDRMRGMALKSEDSDLFAALLSRGLVALDDIDENGETALSRALYFDNRALVVLLLQTGAHFDITNNKLVRRLVVMGFRSKRAEIFAALLAVEAIFVNITDTDGASPLSIAVSNGNPELVILFLQKGAAVDGTDPILIRQILNLAFRKDHIGLFILLVEMEVQVDSGYSVLHEASRYDSLHIVRFLCSECSANGFAYNAEGIRAFDIAVEGDHSELVTYFCTFHYPRRSWQAFLAAAGVLDSPGRPPLCRLVDDPEKSPARGTVPMAFVKVMGNVDLVLYIIGYY